MRPTLLGLLAVATAACTIPLAEEGRPCPCASGWQCCAGENVCVAEGGSCPVIVEGADGGLSIEHDAGPWPTIDALPIPDSEEGPVIVQWIDGSKVCCVGGTDERWCWLLPQSDTDHDGTFDVCEDDNGNYVPDGAEGRDAGAVDLDAAPERDAGDSRDGCASGDWEVVCVPLDGCHLAGTCDPSTGLCSNPIAPNGTACDDGNLCTFGDYCLAGVCVGEDNCDGDRDHDGIPDREDLCPTVYSPENLDTDGEGLGDECDDDDDADLVPDEVDNCPSVSNAEQGDFDEDGRGDACDGDDDNDGIADVVDLCPHAPYSDPASQTDTDGDAIGDLCDEDPDGDDRYHGFDNCPMAANPDQRDTDGDGIGDACDQSPGAGAWPACACRLGGNAAAPRGALVLGILLFVVRRRRSTN